MAAIENNLGRKRTADKYASRTIDLDLIVYGDMAMEVEGSKLPDPEILERPFLAIPLLNWRPIWCWPDMVCALVRLQPGCQGWHETTAGLHQAIERIGLKTMQSLQSTFLQCPYCGEQIEVLVDCSVRQQEYTEDCSVCCRPIIISVECSEGGVSSIVGRTEDE